MKTRIIDFLDTRTDPWTPAYSFQFTEAKRPAAGDWRYVPGALVARAIAAASTGASSARLIDRDLVPVEYRREPATWPTLEQRDRARACFTRRRTVEAALADLRAQGLLTP